MSIFQNWLAPAGASFEHLHKQLVAIDEIGERTRAEYERLQSDPTLYQRWGPEFARQHGLLIAENAYAVAFAGVGHRYPGVDIYTKVTGVPWDLPGEVINDWADMLHATTPPASRAAPMSSSTPSIRGRSRAGSSKSSTICANPAPWPT